MSYLDRNVLCEKYDVTSVQLDAFPWSELETIHSNYTDIREDLAASAKVVVERLSRCKQAHSLKHRLKNPLGLIEKILRKSSEDQDRQIGSHNYCDQITDLIGIRVLYLFRQEWPKIDSFIREHWDFHEDPIAYIREGDDQEVRDAYEKQGCRVRVHPRHYRSVHYVILQPVTRTTNHLVEVQVRTIFEEGWSEVDHRMRYSDGKATKSSDPLLEKLLTAHNRMAGTADEVASYIQQLKLELEKRDAKLAAIETSLQKNVSVEETKSLLKDIANALREAPPSSEEPVEFGKLFFSALEKFGSMVSVNELRQCKGNLEKINSAVEKFYEDEGREPDDFSELVPRYLGENPICPASKKNTYSMEPGSNETNRLIFCSGHWHRSAGIKEPDFPRFDSEKGLLTESPAT